MNSIYNCTLSYILYAVLNFIIATCAKNKLFDIGRKLIASMHFIVIQVHIVTLYIGMIHLMLFKDKRDGKFIVFTC